MCDTYLKSEPQSLSNEPTPVDSPSHLNDQDEWAFTTYAPTIIYYILGITITPFIFLTRPFRVLQ